MSDTVRTPMLLRACMEVLREADEPIQAKEVADRIAQRVSLTPHELTVINDAGLRRWINHLRWRTSEAASAGWLTKRDGLWSITPAGEAAMDKYDADQFAAEMKRQYQEIRKHRKAAVKQLSGDERNIARALSAVEEGSWTSFTALASQADVPAEHVPHFLAQANPALPGSHRVLNEDGTLLPDRLLSATYRGGDMRRKLMSEGVEFDEDGHASPTQRLTANDLAERLVELGEDAEPAQSARAWLVRGSSVEGRDLVPGWQTGGYVSLAGTKLPAITPPVPRDELKAIVEDSYQHMSHAARVAKTAEYDAFLNRMRPGDYLLTTSQGKAFLGRITSDATFVQSEDQRSNLRRTATWFNADRPIPYPKLEDPLPARLASTADVVDLTEDIATIEQLLAKLHVEIEEPAPAPERPLAFRDVDDDLAAHLMIDRDWLAKQAEVLWDRRQLILYGPPGTGKTYLAKELAAHLAGDPSQVKLVQFHPSYTYEDFFEGFRPVQGDDGALTFDLHRGPFRRLVDAAKEHSSDPYFLIIDEINRANLAKVFGELYFLLEYRDDAISLLYSANDKDTFRLPKNVFIIGTMNTTDRSIALVDAAMRRRFAFVELHPAEKPTEGLLRSWLARLDAAGHLHHHRDAADLLDALNARIENRDLAIGPSFLMRESIYGSEDGLNRVWESDILPLLAEHHYGSPPEILDPYRLDALHKALANQRPDPQP